MTHMPPMMTPTTVQRPSTVFADMSPAHGPPMSCQSTSEKLYVERVHLYSCTISNSGDGDHDEVHGLVKVPGTTHTRDVDCIHWETR